MLGGVQYFSGMCGDGGEDLALQHQPVGKEEGRGDAEIRSGAARWCWGRRWARVA